MPREWAAMLQMAATVDGICGDAKWPALVFDSYQSARDWMVDVTPLASLKPVLDVEDCVVFYFGRCTGKPTTKADEVFHLAIMPKSQASLEPFACPADQDVHDPLLKLAFHEARQFADAPTKLRAMETLVCLIIQDSTYSLPANDDDDQTIDWSVIFEALWDALEADGWTVSKILGDKLMYSMPSVDFSCFEVGTTVFDSKRLALKKAIEYYASRSCPTAVALWDAMWIEMEHRNQCTKMEIRNLTFFVTPIVENFNQLQTGETMFATKKDAVIRFCGRIPDSSPVKKTKRVLSELATTAAVSVTNPVVAKRPAPATANAKTAKDGVVVAEDSEGPFTDKPARKSLKRKMPLQAVVTTNVEQPNHRRVAASAYPWGLVWDVLSKDFLWKFKTGKFGFDFYSPDGKLFSTEEDVMQHLVTSDMLPEIERLIKLQGAPTPEQYKENSAKPVANVAKEVVPAKEPAKKSKKKAKQPVEDDESDDDDAPTSKKKAPKPKKRLSYSSPKASHKTSKTASHRTTIAESVGFGVIERVLKSVGWKWVLDKGDYVYCKPHVILGNKGRTFSGAENVDYFRSKELFELYVRDNKELMAFIRSKLRADKGLSPLKDNIAVFDMSSDEDHSSKGRMVRTAKSKAQVVVDDESGDGDVPKQTKAARQTMKPSKAQADVDDDSVDLDIQRQRKDARPIKKPTWLEENPQVVAGVPAFEVKFGNVYKVLQTRGWTHRSGAFGYDYFRPNIKTKADKVLNSTYYQSEADMEIHLRATGEWEEIAQTLLRQHEKAQADLSSASSSPSSESETSDVGSPVASIDEVASRPPSGLFCRMWRRLEENGWTKAAPKQMDGEYMYCSPNGKRYTREELQMHEVEALIAEHKKNDVVEVHDSSDSDDMHNDEAQQDDEDDDVMSVDEDNRPVDTPSHETPVVRSAASKAAPVAAFLSPDETTLKSSDKVVARNVQQDFTPSPHAVAPSKAATAEEPAKERAASPTKKTLMHKEFERVLANLSPGYTTKSPLLHRTREWDVLVDFIDQCIATGQRKSVYVSGSPGCGKSALMKMMEQHVASAWKAAASPTALKVVNLNAMSLGNAASVYKAIAFEVTSKHFSSADEAMAALELAFKSQDTTTFLILDEIDTLLHGKGERDLYQLFEWAHHPFSSMIFVGIANSIDMTERYLPLLKSQDCKPLSVVFSPYTVEGIVDILKQRVIADSLTPKPAIDLMALTYLARKVASTDGDVRKSLSIGRACLLRQQMRDTLTPVTMADMISVMKEYLTSMASSSKWQDQPRMNQLVLFAALQINTDRPGVYSTNAVYDKYCELVRKSMSMLQLISMGEFNQVLDGLAATSLVELKKDKSSFKVFGSPEGAEKFFASNPFFKSLL